MAAASSSTYSIEWSFERGPDLADQHEDTDDEGNPSEDEAGTLLADFLVHLKVVGKLYACDVCVLAYYGFHAGLKGPAQNLAYKPSSQSGKFQRHLDNALALDVIEAGDSYTLALPAYDRLCLSRITEDVVCLPAHEALQDELQASTVSEFKHRESMEGQEWSDVYKAHPVVLAAPEGEPVYPLALYVDGVQFQKRESVVGFYVYNLITGYRHLCLAIRKSSLCRCGCQGHCSIHIIMRLLAWSFDALALGRYPSARHDGTGFGFRDEKRRDTSNKPLMRGAVVHIKGDWAEFAHSFGLP